MSLIRFQTDQPCPYLTCIPFTLHAGHVKPYPAVLCASFSRQEGGWLFNPINPIQLNQLPTSLQQIKPDIFPEIHAVEVDAAGIGGCLLQGMEHIILQRGNG